MTRYDKINSELVVGKAIEYTPQTRSGVLS